MLYSSLVEILHYSMILTSQENFPFLLLIIFEFFIYFLNPRLHIKHLTLSFSEAATGGAVLRNFAKFTGKYLYQSLFFNKVFSCEFCDVSKNTFFTENLQATASVRLSFSTVRKAQSFSHDKCSYCFLYIYYNI